MIVKFLYVIVVMLLSVFSFPNTVFAAQGSIELTLEESQQGNSRENVVFGLTKIAEFKDGQYETIQGMGIDTINFNTITHAQEMQTIIEQIQGNVPIDQKYHTNQNGYFKADAIAQGLYLLQCIDTNAYDQVQSMMIAIPTFDKQESTMNMHLKIAPKHTPNKKLTIKKIDAQTKHSILSNETTFALFTDITCNKEISKVHTDPSTGYASFENLKLGTYYLKEVKAAKGYQKLDHVFRIDVLKNELKIDNKTISSKGQTYIYEIENMKKEEVHTMDQSNRQLYFLLVVLALPCLCVVYRKAKAQK